MFGKFDMVGRIVSSVMGVSIMHLENNAKLFVLLRFKIYEKKNILTKKKYMYIYEKLRSRQLLNTSLEFKYMYVFWVSREYLVS